MSDKIEYLVRGASLKCMCGSETGLLDLPESHGEYIVDNPMIHEGDCEPGINIPSFGICIINGEKCEPEIDGTWLCAHKEKMIDGKPAITTDSALFCSKGSLITPEESGQEDILELLMSLSEEELLKLMNGLKAVSPYTFDPVNVCTGNFAYENEDIHISGMIPLFLKRTYNSVDTFEGVLGKRWIHNHEIYLSDNQDAIQILKPDGCVETYKKNVAGTYQGIPGVFGFVKKYHDNFCYIDAVRNEYWFNQTGNCEKIIDTNKNEIIFHYIAGKLTRVESVAGYLDFQYERAQLKSVVDNSGRTVTYGYNHLGELETVIQSNGGIWFYQYDSDGRMKSIKNPLGIINLINSYDENGRTVYQSFPDDGAMSYEYDDNNRKVVVTEQNKNRIKYYQDEKFRNVRTVYSDGYEVTEYNDNNRKTYFKDKNGNEFIYDYDIKGNLIFAQNPLGAILKIRYNKMGLPVEVRGYDEAVTQYQYDTKGNWVSETDAMGYQTHCEYNSNGLPHCIQAADGSKFQLIYNEKGNIIKIINASGIVTEYLYDDLNRVIQTIDGNQNRTYFEYDCQSNLVKVINAAGFTKCYEYNQQGNVIKEVNYDDSIQLMEYNNIGKLSKMVDASGNATLFHYDIMRNLQEKVDANGKTAKYFYNKLNQLEQESVDGNGTIKYEYDANGNRTKLIGPMGEVYQYYYDAMNQLIKMIDPENSQTEYEYDAVGRLVKISDDLLNVTKRKYNALGLLVKEINSLNQEVSYEYNPIGLLAKVIDSSGKTLQLEYFPGGRLSKKLYSDGRFETFQYDQNGNVTERSNQAGYIINYHYDCLNQIIEINDNCEGKCSFQYDKAGNIIAVVDGNGNQTTYQYDVRRNLIAVQSASGAYAEYEYDKVSNLIAVKQYDGFIENCEEIAQLNRHQQIGVFYHRNPAGQITSVEDALGRISQYSYDVSGKLQEVVDPEGYQTKLAYTETGKIKQVKYADGKSVLYSYNSIKQLVLVEDWLGITRIESDSLGRLEKVVDYQDKEVSYQWNPDGSIRQIQYPDGAMANYEYDSNGRLASLLTETEQVQFQYNQNGWLKQKLFPNGMTSNYQYDCSGKIIEIKHSTRNQLLDSYRYQYDGMGNKTKVVKQRNSLTVESGYYQYQYDRMNRLTAVTKDGILTREYQYDSLSNRIYMRDNKHETSYQYDAGNQLIGSIENGIQCDFQYDLRGNLIKSLRDGKLINEYQYNVRGQLERWRGADGRAASYQYHGLGHRVSKTLGAIENSNQSITIYQKPGYKPYIGMISGRFVADSRVDEVVDLSKSYHNLLFREEHGEAQRFTWAGEVISASQKNKTQFYCLDDLGSPVRFGSGIASQEVYGYDEYGNDIYANKKFSQPFGYTGYQREDAAGYFAQARYYQPAQGRFLGADRFAGVLNSPITLNRYLYCFGNPVNLVDLTGYWPSWSDIGNGIADGWNTVTNSKPWKVVTTTGEIVVGGLSIVGGVSLAVVSLGLTPVSGGVSIGGVILGAGSTIHGVNGVANGIRNIGHMFNGDWEKVGESNYLRDNVYKPAGGIAGKVIGTGVDYIQGNEDGRNAAYYKMIGENVGSLVFSGLDIYFAFKGVEDGIKVLQNVSYLKKLSVTYEMGNYIDGFKRMNDLKILIEGSSATAKATAALNVFINLKAIADNIFDLYDMYKDLQIYGDLEALACP